ncbi:beta-hexosaminidase subunit beta-like [Gigantopelta aegis]|uniref:beta-hexosaminidase subunit beta-like n=1 Tax=Gigantopelta aegis TaxID=1735272 RepID=UPI001B88B1BD|nr:beta-hexosaminidase subunit beta-like [Gigantopelta aegis]
MQAMKAIRSVTLVVVLSLVLAECRHRRRRNEYPDPPPKTKGVPWPMPAQYSTSPLVFHVDGLNFEFVATGKTCITLEEAFRRYYKIIFGNDNNSGTRWNRHDDDGDDDEVVVKNISVNVHECEDVYPTPSSDESYELKLSSTTQSLTSSSVWGALRGLETFSQIVYRNDVGAYIVNETTISDSPRFGYRGIFIDTSLHYIPVFILLQNLDAMAYNKMNVFHWHITDDTSFPYVSKTFPSLSQQGAYSPYNHVYTQDDIRTVLEYARLRGIRVMMEFDMPGHSLAWRAIPDLLARCYDGSTPTGQLGPMDPTLETTYTFLREFFKEWTETFPDSYLHLGGDEVDMRCWENNPRIREFMEKMGYHDDYTRLQQYFFNTVLEELSILFPSRKTLVWQDTIDVNVKVPNTTIVEIWKDMDPGYREELAKTTSLGYTTLLSACWYLNYITVNISTTIHWPDYYLCDPHDFDGTEAQKKLVIGGEACMWTEFVDGTNVIPRLWPRAAAAAERLWSPQSIRDIEEAAPRIEEHRCRMLRRGIQAEPINGPGFCEEEVTNH